MEDWKAAFGEPWDAVVLGTGMKECVISGLLSVAGKKVLHLDRNDYYGGASASLDIHQLFRKFKEVCSPDEVELGKLRDYSIDLVPKFIMAGGQLVKVLIHTGVHNYMEFKSVDGSFVYSSKAAKVCKVPATPEDAMKSSLMGMMEKTRMVQFTLWVSKVKLGDRSTWKAGAMTKKELALDTMSGESFFKYWGAPAAAAAPRTPSREIFRAASRAASRATSHYRFVDGERVSVPNRSREGDDRVLDARVLPLPRRILQNSPGDRGARSCQPAAHGSTRTVGTAPALLSSPVCSVRSTSW